MKNSAYNPETELLELKSLQAYFKECHLHHHISQDKTNFKVRILILDKNLYSQTGSVFQCLSLNPALFPSPYTVCMAPLVFSLIVGLSIHPHT